MSDGPPESAHCRSAYAVSPGTLVWTGGPNVCPPSSERATSMLWLASPDPRLWYSRYTVGLPSPSRSLSTANHWRSWSTSCVDPRDWLQCTPLSSVYELGKLIPAKSSSEPTIRPRGAPLNGAVATMSTSIEACVCPAGLLTVGCHVWPPSIDL